MKKRKKRYKSVITKRIFRSLERIGACFLMLVFLSSAVIMRGTNAGFLDEEKSEGNVFGASTLDFSVSSGADFSPKASPSMETVRTISLAKDGLENFQYRVSADNFSGDTDLCDKLEIKDDLDDTFQPLDSYVSSNADNTVKTNWTFTIRLIDNDEDLADETCDFDLVTEAWQMGFVYGAGGFTDIETLPSSVESEHWTNIADHLVVNEVYYDVASSGKGVEGDNEWVEIYNPTSSAVNLKDWEICDSVSCDTIASSDLDIPANGYVVITNEASTWGFWTVPGSAIKIVLGSDIGSGLNNDGDSVILKNSSGTEIDSLSYGINITKLNPACPDVIEGHSLARKPAGQDLDVNSDFEDLSSPNPGTNPHTIVMNEIMPDPIGNDDAKMPEGEWVELYNYGEYDVELSDWKLQDGDGNILKITENNTDVKNTTIKAGNKLVVYRDGDSDFDLKNSGDTISLIDEKDLVKDSYTFGQTTENKSIARFPDAVGPWIDPDGTPGEKNEMNAGERDDQILKTFAECFSASGDLNEESYSPICQPEYLKYLGLIKELDGKKANLNLVEAIQEKLAQAKLEAEKVSEEPAVSQESDLVGEVTPPIETPAEEVKTENEVVGEEALLEEEKEEQSTGEEIISEVPETATEVPADEAEELAAKLKAEEEAKLEAEAKAKAEEEAKLKAKLEAEAKAEEEAQAAAEAEEETPE